MKPIFLHGAPATGKLTVARALLGMVPGRLFDNHAAIDLARTIFDFGAPGFWELVHNVRYAAFDAAAEHGVPLVVTTFCYAEPDDRAQFEKLEEIMQRHGGKLLPVFLHCSRERGRAQGRQRRACRAAEDDLSGKPDQIPRRLQILAGAAVRLPDPEYRGGPGGGDRAGNYQPLWPLA
jgi:hypothetical protein